MKEERKRGLAIVTGGSRGLGAALVAAYAKRGWSVLEFSRRGAAAGDGIESVRADLARPAEARATVLEALRRRLDDQLEVVHFVNNAGMLGPVGAPSLEGPEGWQTNLDVNLVSGVGVMGAFLAAARNLPARKVLANVSSGAATRGIRGWSTYCAAKAGLEHFVRAVALEQNDLPHPVIAVNVGPGVVDTDMQAALRATDPAAFPDHERFVELHTAGKLSQPADVAKRMLAILDGELEGGARYDA